MLHSHHACALGIHTAVHLMEGGGVTCPTGHDEHLNYAVLPDIVPCQWPCYGLPRRKFQKTMPHRLAGSSSTWQASGEPPRQTRCPPPGNAEASLGRCSALGALGSSSFCSNVHPKDSPAG